MSHFSILKQLLHCCTICFILLLFLSTLGFILWHLWTPNPRHWEDLWNTQQDSVDEKQVNVISKSIFFRIILLTLKSHQNHCINHIIAISSLICSCVSLSSNSQRFTDYAHRRDKQGQVSVQTGSGFCAFRIRLHGSVAVTVWGLNECLILENPLLVGDG
jgi:hypothetical protein